MNNERRLLANERGVALPMSMLALLILSGLVIAFSVLAITEPTIASNHLMAAQARSIAEAGAEQAIWALNNPANPKGIPTAAPLPASWTAPAPYDGSRLVPVSTGGSNSGGFRVTVTKGASSAELVITSVGWVPNDSTTSPKAHQKITVMVFNPQFMFTDPPAALSVRGELQAGGNSIVDSRADTSCGAKSGTLTTGQTSIKGNAADIFGADGNSVRNQMYDASNGGLPPLASDIIDNVATTLADGTPAFDKYIWTDADVSALRAYAQANNGKPGVTYLQGAATFSSSRQIPDGLVFVDTVSGKNIAQDGAAPATPSSDFASVDIQGNAGGGTGGVFSGLLFVNGTLSIAGNFAMRGFAYAQNDVSYHGVGAGGVWGAVMSRNIRDLSSTSIDSDLLGNALINYDCQYAKTGGNTLPNTWSFEAGTYRELSGS